MENEGIFYPEKKEETGNLLLEGPRILSPEDKENLQKELLNHVSSFDKDHSRNQKLVYRLGNNNGKPFFIIECKEEYFETLDESLREKFTKNVGRYIFKFGDVPALEKAQSEDDEGYLVAPRRDLSEQKNKPKPQKIEEGNLVELIELLKTKKVLFYTGAGLSIAGGVWGMAELMKNMRIDMDKDGADDFLYGAIADPEKTLELWQKNLVGLHGADPTPAHESIARMAIKLRSKIFTENHDTLQEKTGVEPNKISGPWLKENVQPEWLKDIDAVITVGLSYDDRGFLGWYKKNNPNGKIIAVNLSQPSYLGSEDFLLKGDCQKIVPELEKEFAVKE